MLGGGVDALEQRVDRHTGPDRVQLRPLRDAVDVDGDLLPRQRLQLVPAPAARLVDLTPERERPALQLHARSRPRGEDREVAGDVLTGRHTPRLGVLPAPSMETA